MRSDYSNRDITPMTSSDGSEEPGVGEEQIQADCSWKQRKDNDIQAQVSIRPKVLPHFIHTHDDVRVSEETISESTYMQPIPSAPKNTVQSTEKPGNVNDAKRMIHQISLETSAESLENTESSGALDDDESTDDSEGVADAVVGDKKKRGKKRKAGKIDRSTLRKGKWTVRETNVDEFDGKCSRIQENAHFVSFRWRRKSTRLE